MKPKARTVRILGSVGQQQEKNKKWSQHTSSADRFKAIPSIEWEGLNVMVRIFLYWQVCRMSTKAKPWSCDQCGSNKWVRIDGTCVHAAGCNASSCVSNAKTKHEGTRLEFASAARRSLLYRRFESSTKSNIQYVWSQATSSPIPSMNESSSPPRGVKDGGIWGVQKWDHASLVCFCVTPPPPCYTCASPRPNTLLPFDRYIGSTTKGYACLGCLCFCIPGCLILCCPCDERDAYKVDGQVCYSLDNQIVLLNLYIHCAITHIAPQMCILPLALRCGRRKSWISQEVQSH